MKELARKIHFEALDLLESVGVFCPNEEIRNIVLKTGTSYYDDTSGRLLLDPYLVQDCVRNTPGVDQFIADSGVELGSFGGGGTATLIKENGDTRLPTDRDVINIMKIAESFGIPFMFRGVGPKHGPEEDMKQINLMRENYSGYIYVYNESMEGIEATSIEYRNDPRIATCHSIFYSPLMLNDAGTNVKVFLESCRKGLPLFLTVMPISFITGPATIYGLALQAHAECLCGLVLGQILSPGITVIPSAFPLFADPSLDYNISFGSISHQLVNILIANVYGYLDLPRNQDGCSAGHYPNDHTFDNVTRAFKVWNTLDGWHQCRHAFGFSEGQMVYSIEQMYRDIAIMEHVMRNDLRYRPVPVANYDLEAKDVIWEVCKDNLNNYKDHPHTLKHAVPVV